MNPCELVARLNPTSVRFGAGRGGVPEYTAQDIAAAIGMVRDVFAREVFCAIWWPAGASLVWRDLDALIATMQFGEWRDRADNLVTAQIAVAQAEADKRADKPRARAMLAAAKGKMWPSLGYDDAYSYIRSAVIAELRAPRTCPVCNGRCQVKVNDLMVSCPSCGATGRTSISDSQRALMLKRNESTYRRSWKEVYEWTYRRVSDAEVAGRIALGKRLDEAA